MASQSTYQNTSGAIAPPDSGAGQPVVADTITDTATPGARRGTATHASSDGAHDLRREGLVPYLVGDIEQHEMALADDFLRVFLLKVVDASKGPADEVDLLNECLTHARKKVCSDSIVRQHLTEYCAEKKEAPRYEPFVRACNRILEILKEDANNVVGKHRLRPCSAMDPMFCRNDPREIHAQYPTAEGKTLKSTLKPDVILVSYAAALARHPQWADDAPVGQKLYDILACQPMTMEQNRKNGVDEIPFTWQHILSSLEFKASGKIDTSIPVKFDTNDMSDERPAVTHVKTPTLGADLKMTGALGKKRGRDAASTRPSSSGGTEPAPKKTRSASKAQAKPISVAENAMAESAPSGSGSGSRGLPGWADDDAKVPPIIQNAIYGTNMICRSPAVAHAINLMFFDEIAFIWWFDRYGAIQSTGINFISDLPRFVVLLMAFQRFQLRDWGFIPELEPEAERIHNPTGAPRTKSSCVVSFKGAKGAGDTSYTLHHDRAKRARFVFKGRGTRIVPASDALGRKLFAKITWPDVTRESEYDIVKSLETEKGLKGLTDVSEHLPNFRACKTYAEYDTSSIRHQLKVKPWGVQMLTRSIGDDKTRGSRVLRILMTDELLPLERLSGPAFLKAFLDIVLCHFVLWTRGGVCHRDLSLDNLMYRETPGGVIGVLNDFDLATRIDQTAHAGLERTGTLPFMALEILDAEAKDKRYVHLYRHDLEAFYWILIWVCNCVENGKEIDLNGSIFRPWKTGDYDICVEKKLRYEYGSSQYASLVLPTQSALWEIAKSWIKHLKRTLRLDTTEASVPWTVATDATESFTDFCRLLESKEVMNGLRSHQTGEQFVDCIKTFLVAAQRYVTDGKAS